MTNIDWYFDFISPYAYFSSETLDRIPENISITAKPILFGGLLHHWQTKGPAEMAPMRQFTYRHIQWIADQNNISLNFPPEHPFNPLRLLRLCIAMGSTIRAAQSLFRFVWQEGCSSDNQNDWENLISSCGIGDIEMTITQQSIKDKLRTNTEEALSAGVFGVPSFVINNEVFWGYDAMDFLIAYIKDPELLNSEGMKRADSIPEGKQRL